MKRFGLALYTDTFDEGLTFALDRGIGVEIQTFTDTNVLSGDWKGVLKKYKDILKKRRPVFVTFHAPYVDIAPLVRDPFVKEAVAKRMEWAFDTARQFKAEGVVVHLSSPLRRIDYNLDLWIDRQHHFWKPFAKKAEKEGIKIFLENSYEPDPAFLVLLHDHLDSEAVSLCFDFGHAVVLGEGNIDDWIEAAGNRIAYLHLHNNDGHSDLHASLGDGVLDFKELLERMDVIAAPQATSIIEVDAVTDMVASLKYLDEIGWGNASKRAGS
jgi:sugar phosphate isomerase/epimerase